MGHGPFANARKSQESQQSQETIEKIVNKSHENQKKKMPEKSKWCFLYFE